MNKVSTNDVRDEWDDASQRHIITPGRIAYKRSPYLVYPRFKLYQIFWSKLHRAERALEVGSGAGYNLEYLLENNIITYADGIDLSKEMINLSQLRLSRFKTNHFESNYLDFLAGGKYDLILSVQSINYFSDLNAFLTKSFELLETNGRLIIIDSQSAHIRLIDKLKNNSVLRRIFRKKRIINQTSNLHFHSFNTLKLTANEIGFECEQTRFFGHFLFKTTLGFQFFAENTIFKSKFSKICVRFLCNIIYLLSSLEMHLLSNFNINKPLYSLTLKRIK